jgi:hypothetical protein
MLSLAGWKIEDVERVGEGQRLRREKGREISCGISRQRKNN